MSDASASRGDTRRQQYLQAMGIQVWQARHPATAAAPATAGVEQGAAVGANAPVAEWPAAPMPAAASVERAEPLASAPVRRDVSAMDWAQLQDTVSHCRLCELHTSRTQTVFGVGNRHADWLVIGEAPGRDEDLQGEQVYIANILKCRPPNNRDPRPEEVVCCEPYLARQIALVQPRIILAVGRIAAQNLLKTDTPIGKLRGKVHRYADTGIALIATYHPAYLLRSPLDKRKAWADLQLAMATAAGAVP